MRRVIPVVRGLAAEGVLVSVDTMRAAVAPRAVKAGAVLVNDVSGGLADPAMIPSVAACGGPFGLMHWRGFGHDMNSRAYYGDVVAEAVAELRVRIDAAVAEGIAPERLVVDPGLGFAKKAWHDLDLDLVARLANIPALGELLLVSGSRKRFLGHVGPCLVREEGPIRCIGYAVSWIYADPLPIGNSLPEGNRRSRSGSSCSNRIQVSWGSSYKECFWSPGGTGVTPPVTSPNGQCQTNSARLGP